MAHAREGSDRQIIIHAIMDWMKHHGQQFIPSYKQITDGLQISNLLTSFTQLKKSAFAALKKAGYILEYSTEPKTYNARIVDFKVPDGIGKKIVDKLIPIDEDGAEIVREAFKALPKSNPAKESIQRFQNTEADEQDEELAPVIVPHKPNESKPKPPFLFYHNKTNVRPQSLECIGKMLIEMANLSDDTKLDVKIKILEGGGQ